VTLDIPIETAGKRGHRIARASYLSEAARLNILTSAWQVRSSVRTSLLDFVAAQRREKILSAQLALQGKNLRSLEQRRQAGAISGAELGVVHVALARAQADLADSQRLQAEARAHVAEAVGVPLSALNDVELSFDFLQPPALDELTSADARRQALRSRADILGALAGYDASQSALQLEIAKQYPDVHLSPGYQWDQGENKWQLGITVELPIINQNQGPIAEALARRAEAAARFEAAQAKAVAEIDRAVAVLSVCRKQLLAAQALTAAQKSQSESVAAQVAAGAAEELDWDNAEFEAGTAVQVELDAEIRLQQAIGALEDAVQRPLTAPAPDHPETNPHEEKVKP
jgi:outer membrane protein TolC